MPYLNLKIALPNWQSIQASHKYKVQAEKVSILKMGGVTTDKYIEQEMVRIEASQGRRKRERTRDNLLLATANCLVRSGYSGLRVLDIIAEANVADGTFYVYFKNKSEAADEVILKFLGSSMGPDQTHEERGSSAFEAIRSSNRRWFNVVKDNPGMSRVVFQAIDIDEGFRKTYAERNQEWHAQVAKSIIKRYPEGALDEKAVLFATAAMDTMTMEMARALLITETEKDVWKALSPDLRIDDAVDLLSVIWHRTFYPNRPIDPNSPLRPNAQAFAELRILSD